MDSTSLMQQAKLVEALAALKDEVRGAPAKTELRVKLFALNCVLGNWEKASADLDAIKSLDESWTLPSQLYRSLIRAEQMRGEVFAGKSKPLVMGEPEAWLAWNIQALEFDAQGKAAEAAELRRQSWDACPELKCSVDGRACAWVSDWDRRIGPVLEAYLEGKYYWIPYGRLKKITITPPEFLVETIWVPAALTLASGVDLSVQLPCRYPGSEKSTDGRICLGQITEWVQVPGGEELPVGQKMIQSESDEFGLLGCKAIEFE